MADLRELYQDVILEHSKAPRNFKKLQSASHHAEGFNPLCGDRLKLYLRLDGDRIADVKFDGSGCAISKASVSTASSGWSCGSIGMASTSWPA